VARSAELACSLTREAPLSDELKTVLFDPQTAGGLLFSVAAVQREQLLVQLQAAGVPARHVGDVTESRKPLLRIY